MFYENCSYWTNLNKCSWKSSNIDISEIRVLVSLELKLLSPEMKDLILLLGESMQPFEDLLFCNHTMNRIRIWRLSTLHNWIHHMCYLNGQKQLLGHPEIYVVVLSNLLNINYHLLPKLIFYAQVKFLNIFSLIGQINSYTNVKVFSRQNMKSHKNDQVCMDAYGYIPSYFFCLLTWEIFSRWK